MATSTSKEDKQKRIVGVLILAAAGTLILTSGPEQVNQQIITAQLERFSAYANSFAARSGKQAEFSYGNVSIGGSFLNRYATITDVALSVSSTSGLTPVSYQLTTPVIAVVPDKISARRVYYGFGAPVTIHRNDQPMAEISFSEPLKYGHIDAVSEGATTLQQSVVLPETVTYTPLKGEDRGQPTIFSYGDDSTIEIRRAMDDSFRHAKYNINSITITEPGDKILSADKFETTLHETRKEEDGMLQGDYQMELTGLKTNEMKAACDSHVRISYLGDQPLFRLAGMVPSLDGSEVNINAFQLECQEFGLEATGKLSREGDDPLPSGNIDISISNANKLLASNLMSPTSKALLRELLVKVTGQPAEQITNVDIPLRRTVNGTFYIGDVTFEEMAASLLKELLNLNHIMPPTNAVPMPPVVEDKKLDEKEFWDEEDESENGAASPTSATPTAGAEGEKAVTEENPENAEEAASADAPAQGADAAEAESTATKTATDKEQPTD